MAQKIYPVILSGGFGSRLWPMSRDELPKQFISTIEKQTFFNSTIDRFKSNIFKNITVIGNFEHRYLIYDAIAKTKTNPEAVLLEPVSKNTSASITISALHIHQKDPNAIILVVPSDHLIESKSKFNDHIKKISQNLHKDFIYVFGVKPKIPSTSFGYIKIGKEISSYIHKVDKFIEKPNLKNAKKYFADNKFYWNAGMFLFSAETLIREMKIHSKKTLEICERLLKKKSKHYEFTNFPKSLFNTIKNEQFDTALIKKTAKAIVTPIDYKWFDIGSWSGYWEAFKKNKDGNILDKNVFTEDLKNSTVKINDGSTAVVMGLDDISIVREKDALLVIKNKYSEKVKDILMKLKMKKNKILDLNKTEFKHWGNFENIIQKDDFLVKIIRIKPRSKISVKYLSKRSEHWIVSKGEATILSEDKVIQLKKSQLIHPVIGQKYKILNNSNSILEFIQIQIDKTL